LCPPNPTTKITCQLSLPLFHHICAMEDRQNNTEINWHQQATFAICAMQPDHNCINHCNGRRYILWSMVNVPTQKNQLAISHSDGRCKFSQASTVYASNMCWCVVRNILLVSSADQLTSVTQLVGKITSLSAD